LLKCGRRCYIVEMRTLPLYCRNADVAAKLSGGYFRIM
jgi:hypothetical protein